MGRKLIPVVVGSADGLIAAWMYREGILNPLGVAIHSGLSLALGACFVYYGIREEPCIDRARA